MKLYFYPSCPREGYTNPYCINYKHAIGTEFRLLDADNKITKMKTATLLRYSFVADVVILNWIENVANLRMGKLQYLLTWLSFLILRIRKKKIVWMFHNITPHEGRDKYSDHICDYLYEQASLIISHSEEAANYAKQFAKCPVECICHPISNPSHSVYEGTLKPVDILIWGAILPYKGVLEFLQSCKDSLKDFRILILGKCKDSRLRSQIEEYAIDNVSFENRFADFDELAAYIKKSKYVLFPYVGESVSSSGVLMDTLAMGGCPVGPNKGAFRDLQEEGVCLCYNDYDELIDIINKDAILSVKQREDFVANNSWSHFSEKLKKLLE